MNQLEVFTPQVDQCN